MLSSGTYFSFSHRVGFSAPVSSEHLAVQWATGVVEWGAVVIPHTFALSLLDGAYWSDVRFTSFSSHLTSFSFSVIRSEFFPHCLTDELYNHCQCVWWGSPACTAYCSWLSLLRFPLMHDSGVLPCGSVCFAGHGYITLVISALCAWAALWTSCQAQLSESWNHQTDWSHGTFRSWQCRSMFQHPQKFHQPCVCPRRERAMPAPSATLGCGMAVACCAVTTSAQLTVLHGYKLQFRSSYSSE